MNTNIDIKEFILENIAFARTFVIKCEAIAKLDNKLMKTHYNLDSGRDKAKWRYYMNLNGEYHQTDEPMYINSLDDGTTILFSKENLQYHLATKRAYRQGSYYYTRLEELYSSQTELIKGIINPIPPEESIPAKDYQILRFNKDYVKWNEHQLIPELQEYIYKLAAHSMQTEYLYTDNLMLSLLLGNLHASLLNQLIGIRYRDRRTRYAHSFYIWSHLQSYGVEKEYQNLLNQKQTMYLFRNIDYIMRNQGKQKTFEELIEILLTERNIPLSEYEMFYDTENMLDDLIPHPKYVSRNLNLLDLYGEGRREYEISRVTKKEIPDTLDNEKFHDVHYEKTFYDSQFGLENDYKIKVLESELTDATNLSQDTFFTILFNQWIYLAKEDVYTINLDITDTKTGNHIKLNTKESLVLWFHLFNQMNKANCNNIPDFPYVRAMKLNPPSRTQLKGLGHQDIINDAWLDDVEKTYIDFPRIISPELFYLKSKEVYDVMWVHRKMSASILDISYHAQRKNVLDSLYETGVAKLTDFKTYSEFLQDKDLDFSEYNEVECLELMSEIWKKATGWGSFPYVTLAQIQSGLIKLMKFLGSYTVQYINEVYEEDGLFEIGHNLLTGNSVLMGIDDGISVPFVDSDGVMLTTPNRYVGDHHLILDQTINPLNDQSVSVEAHVPLEMLIGQIPNIVYEEPNEEFVSEIFMLDQWHLVEEPIELTDRDYILSLIPTPDKTHLKSMVTEEVILTGRSVSGKFEAVSIDFTKDQWNDYDEYGLFSNTYNQIRMGESVDGYNQYRMFIAVKTGVTDGRIPINLTIRNTETGEKFEEVFYYEFTSDANSSATFTIEPNQKFPIGGKRAKVYYQIEGMTEEEVYRETASVALYDYSFSSPDKPIRVSGTQVLPGEYYFYKSFWLEEVYRTFEEPVKLLITFTNYLNIDDETVYLKTYGFMYFTPDMVVE